MSPTMNPTDAEDSSFSPFGPLVRRFVALMLVTAVGAALWRFPFAPLLLSLGLIIYCAILYRYPLAWIMVLPALLPVLDLAPWSGWFFFDELDFVVLVTVAAGLWRSEPRPSESRALGVSLSCAIGLLALSYSISLSIGLLPLPPWDANAFASYYSHYNSARMSKGVFEALALFYIFLRQRGDERRCAALLVTGMVVSVTGVVVAVLWEKFRFTGLMDFASEFRVTATFSGLHNGGNDLEAYLVLAQPFIIAAMIMRRNWLANIGGALLFVLSTYALFVTFSRAGLMALIVNGLVLTFALAVSFRRQGFALLSGGLRMALLLGSGAAIIVVLVLGGTYFQTRLSAARQDWQYRVLQSRKTVEMMRPDWRTTWFGMGVGSYPAVVYERNPQNNRPSAYRFEMDGNNQFVRLFPGIRLYFGQWLGAITSFEKYRLILKARAHGAGSLTGFLCEKTLQYSFSCASHSFELKPSEGWVEHQAEIDAEMVGYNEHDLGWFSRRPVEFAFSNSSKAAVIDVDNVRLFNAAGQNLLANGNFSLGADRWFFTVDDHTPWQNWNHVVHLFFEQGWFGVASFLIFLGCVYARLGTQVVRGHWLAAVAVAALSSFLSVGIFGFLFDTPRMALIFFFLALVFARGLSAPINAAKTAPTA
jgi:hypothetical protein